MTLMLRRKEPMKKDSAGLVNEREKCMGCRSQRVSMQVQRRRKRAMLKRKIIRPIVWRPGWMLVRACWWGRMGRLIE
jgi:hypothetical protein